MIRQKPLQTSDTFTRTGAGSPEPRPDGPPARDPAPIDSYTSLRQPGSPEPKVRGAGLDAPLPLRALSEVVRRHDGAS